MCGNLLKKWVVLMVCVCGVAAAVKSNGQVTEVNEPWVAAEHLTPGWEFMTLATQLFNPEVLTDRPATPGRSLSFGGRIEVIDPARLIGLSMGAEQVKAFDEVGGRI